MDPYSIFPTSQNVGRTLPMLFCLMFSVRRTSAESNLFGKLAKPASWRSTSATVTPLVKFSFSEIGAKKPPFRCRRTQASTGAAWGRFAESGITIQSSWRKYLSVNLMCPWSQSIAKARDSRDFPLKRKYDFLAQFDLIIRYSSSRATWRRWGRGCSRHKTPHPRSAKDSPGENPIR